MTQLDRYVAGTACRAILMVAAGMTALFSLLAFVEELGFVGQGHYRLVDALGYVALTMPARLLQLAPVSVLLGCLLALGGLARSYELAAMRSLGMSESRIIGSVLLLCVPVIAALFLVAQFVVPPFQQRAQALRTAALFSSAVDSESNSFWAESGGQYLNVRRFGDDGAPRAVDIFTFDAQGRLESFIHAKRATIRPGGVWRLTDVLRKRVIASHYRTEHLAALDWRSFISREQIALLRLSPEAMPPVALYRYVRTEERRHRPTTRLREELWARASLPLSIIAMVMIAGPFVFRLPRAQNAGQMIVIGGVFGIGFTLIQQIVDRLEMLLDLNPMATAFAPPLMLMALAASIGLRTLE